MDIFIMCNDYQQANCNGYAANRIHAIHRSTDEKHFIKQFRKNFSARVSTHLTAMILFLVNKYSWPDKINFEFNTLLNSFEKFG